MTTSLRDALPEAALIEEAAGARAAAITWLEDQLEPDGAPVGAAEKNTWWRVPWALSVAGAPVSAAAVLGWAERNALTYTGDLRPGPAEFDSGASPIYELSALAIAAWRLGRYDLANALLDTCAVFQSQVTGGVYDRRARQGPRGLDQDMLKTGQLGVAAVVANRRDLADPIRGWFEETWARQTGLPSVLQVMRDDTGAVIAPADDADPLRRFMLQVDFREPFQAYFNPGIAAAFLIDYGLLTGAPTRDLARQFLGLNVAGSPVQFEDTRTVQICKFGWGVACDVRSDARSPLRPEAVRMLRWFLDRQNDDGSWSPSSFGNPAPAPAIERLWKTAEHLMELTFLTEALHLSRHATPRTEADA